ncbi:MAG: DNA mismatch repair protein MutT, partial [Mycobacterium sp.]
MRGDGNGWVVSATGSRYWGRYGAAGLLLRAPA